MTAIKREKPDVVMLQGDTTTTFAAALAAFYRRVPVAHVEADLRTGDFENPFPEELNRASSKGKFLLFQKANSYHF